MSGLGRSTTPNPDLSTLTLRDEDFHPDFRSLTADCILCTPDSMRFKCHRVFLEHASPVFSTMFMLPQPHNPVTGNHIATVDLPEDAVTLEILLRLIYPTTLPVVDSLDKLSNAMLAAEKYDMTGIISKLRFYLRDPMFLESDPLHVYAIACHYAMVEEIRLASRATLAHEAPSEDRLAMLSSEGMKMEHLFALLSLRHKRIEGMRAYVDGPNFEGNGPDYSCVTCEKKLNDIAWPFLKASIVKEMYRRPLGDMFFETDFLMTTLHAFIDCKCDKANCGERVIYEKAKTLAMITAHLRSLPDCVDLE